MGKNQSLTDAIRAAVPPCPRRSRPWWEKLDAETLAELEAIRTDHLSGRLPGSRQALAKAITDQLNARGLSDIGVQGVTTWLRGG